MANAEHVRAVAIKMAKSEGLINISRKALCEKAGVADQAFHFITGMSFADFIMDIKKEVGPSAAKVAKARAHPELRKEHLMEVALTLSVEKGYNTVTRADIAEVAGVSLGLITNYFGNMTQLRRSIMRQAVTKGCLPVIAQGLVVGDDQAKKAPDELKNLAIATLSLV